MIDFEDIVYEDNSVPYEFEGNEDFYNFLVDNNIYENYINYFNNNNYYFLINITLKEFLKEIPKRSFITSAFIWTKKDSDFWIEYNRKWIEYLSL